MVDKEGRLFGRVNIIDLGVVLLVIISILTWYAGNKMISIRSCEKTISVEIKVKFPALFPELANVIKVGDAERDIEGRVLGRIESVPKNYPTVVPILAQGKNVMEMIEHPRDRDVLADLRILCKDKNGTLYYKKDTVKIGNTFKFSPDRYEVSGVIVDIKYFDGKKGRR